MEKLPFQSQNLNITFLWSDPRADGDSSTQVSVGPSEGDVVWNSS